MKRKRRKRRLWLLLVLLCLLGATVGARALLPKIRAQAVPPAPTEAAPAPAATPQPETPAPAAPAPTPAPMPPEATRTPKPEKTYPLIRGYNEKTYKLASDLVYTYAAKQDATIAEELALLEELKNEDYALGGFWQDVYEYWRYVNSDFTAQPGAVPEGLAEDDSLCIVVLGFQLEPDGGMAAELKGRCETALACLERYPNALLAVTGGGTAFGNRSKTEGGVMAAWFSEHGVAAEKIITEDASLTTADNAVFTCKLLREKAPQVRQLLLVSSDYHLPLGCLLFEEKALLYAYEEGTKPFTVAAWAAWDCGGRFLPDTSMQQKSYVWSVADPKY
ncbi:MAG: YdcF family protein [Oscillospiraceae bacterium]|nr:YdcF family protein [Oscillospiraceae bacterium]